MMGKSKKLLSILAVLLCSSFCFAKQISFEIIQHYGDSEDILEQSLVLEDELLNNFFNNGYIVTNSPSSISKDSKTDDKLLNEGLKEALEGFSDYFVLIKVFFEDKDDIVILTKTEWSVYEAKNKKKIKSGKIKVTPGNDGADILSEVSVALIKEIQNSIKD